MEDLTDVHVGIIGLGNIGRYHADRLRELGVHIAGGMDIKPEARERFTAEYGVAVYDDYDALFDVADALIVTTPNKFHEEYAIAALEADLHVLLEKPLAHTIASAQRIARAAEESDGICMVGFHNRYRDPVEVLADRIETGQFGEVSHVEANYVRRRGVPGRGSWFTSREVAGGGALIDIGVHAVDLALYLIGFPEVLEVSGVTRKEFGDRDDYTYLQMWGRDTGASSFDVEDSASAFIRCADGKTIALEVAWAANRPTNDEVIVRGTEAGARFDRGEGSLDVFETGRGGAPHFNDTTVRTREHDAHAAEQRAFLRSIVSGDPPERNTVDEALAVQAVIDAVYRSDDQGRAIRLDEEEATVDVD